MKYDRLAMRGGFHRRDFPKLILSLVFLFLTSAAELGCGSPGSDLPARLELSRNVFPASSDCELPLFRAKDCPDPQYVTLTLTYSVGGNTVFEPHGSITTITAYQYGGEYRTEPEYTRHTGWPPPQTTDATAPNYSTAQVIDNPYGPVHTRVQRLENRKLLVRFDSRVGPGARIQITYGDRSGGSPGYLVPTLPLDIDLVVEEDPANDGAYRPVDAPMPTLKVIGTRLDRFVVTAPSTPRSKEFDIIVSAMQGADEIGKSMFLVQDFTGTIHFTSSDSGAVLPDDYTFTPQDRGSRKFRVSLSGLGIHTIGVRESETGITGTSNQIQNGKQDPFLFWGALHQHTNIGGHGWQTPQFAFEYGRDVAGLDFLALTEHCGKKHYDWRYSSEVADGYYRPGEFVTFNGYEWGHELFGHRHVVYLNASREECYCQQTMTNQDNRLAETLDDLFKALTGRDALLIPHHTAWKMGPNHRVVLGSHPKQKLFEIYSKHGSSEKSDNAPYTIHGSRWSQFEKGNVFFQDAIANGSRFGVTSGTDDHFGMPGGQVSYSLPPELGQPYRRKGLTGVYANQLTRENIWENLNGRRTYGTTGARIILDFRVNGHMMGEEFTSTTPPEIEVDVAGTAEIGRIFIIKNGEEVIYETSPGSAIAKFTITDADVAPGKEYSYYLRVEQVDSHLAWSSPVWVTIP